MFLIVKLWVINRLFQNAEDQLFGTCNFCECMKEKKLDQFNEGGGELNFTAKLPKKDQDTLFEKTKM